MLARIQIPFQITQTKHLNHPTPFQSIPNPPTKYVFPFTNQLDGSEARENAATDKNMATMFDILRRKKSVKLQNLILNRLSFAQTAENLFALSFLAKDGRVQISVDNNGTHLVSPTNAPDANLVSTGEVIYRHFVFRFDFEDWKIEVPPNLIPDKFPHHMERGGNSTYRSKSILGDIYDKVDTYNDGDPVTVWKLPFFEEQINQIPTACRQAWRELYVEYKGEMTAALKAGHESKSESAAAVYRLYKRV